jgi:transposase
VGVRSRRGPELQKTLLPDEQTRPDVARRRARWKAYQGRIAPQRLVFIAALRHDRIDAPWIIDGPINAPTLAPGDVVVRDNLGSHKGKAARAAVRARGAHLIFLPPYSPHLNSIKPVFAKLKHLMRKAPARDVETTWRKAGQLLALFSPQQRANYLVNAEYGPSNGVTL